MIATLDGVPLTAAAPSGALRFDEAIESYLASRADTPALLQQILREDPDHLMAACFMGYLTRLAGDPVNSARAVRLHGDLVRRLADGAGTAWERAHVGALGLWNADDLGALTRHLESVCQTWPGDVLALRMLHYLYFYDGDPQRMRDSVAAGMAPFRGHRLEGYLKGMLAFGLEECGDYRGAEDCAREALDANGRDLWAAHALAHVLQMQGRTREGVHWVESLRPHWGDANNFRWHLSWHQALYHLTERDLDAVLELYEAEVGPAVEDDFYLDLCNAVSLLLRLEALDCAVGDRWQRLAQIAERHVADTELVFASLHHLIPLLRVGSEASAQLLETLDRWAQTGTSQGRLVRHVARDAAEFLLAVRAGEPRRALALFDGLRGRLHRIGGSRAQRELFDVAALDTARRSGDHAWAESFTRRYAPSDA